MSHTTTLKGLQIKDVAALRQTVVDLQSLGVKCSLVENQKPRMYFQNQSEMAGEQFGKNGGLCEFVLKLDDSRYDVGFDLGIDGTYSPVFDAFGGSVQRVIGARQAKIDNYGMTGSAKTIGLLLQNYAKNAAINSAVSQGYSVDSVIVDDAGTVQLVLGVN